MFGDDAPTLLADFGDSVTWTPSVGGDTLSGPMILDQQSDVMESGSSISRQYSVTFATTDWPGLKRGEIIVIGGSGGNSSFRLRTDPRVQDDAVFSTVGLTKV